MIIRDIIIRTIFFIGGIILIGNWKMAVGVLMIVFANQLLHQDKNNNKEE